MNKSLMFKSFVVLFAAMVAAAAVARAADAGKEKELIEKLRSDAPAADKAVACKHLSVYGSKDAVPELAKLLANEQLASWSRIALEAIPGPEASEALRKAIDSLQGRLLVGTINSIGVRRDAEAVAPLTAQLKNADADVASAAAVALGHVADDAATKSLREALAGVPEKVRPAVAEGCILCAERLLDQGREKEAVEIYDEVRKADLPKQKILEATRGAILARKADGIPLLVEQLKSPDKSFFNLGLSTARELPGGAVADALAAELSRTTPEREALLLVAFTDRKEKTIPSAVLEVAKSGPKEVRIAAVGVIGRLGDASSLSTLLQIATDSDAELAQAAKTALIGLPGEGVNSEIVARLAKADVKTLPVLIELVGQRRLEATPALVKSVGHNDATIRQAALTALGETVGAKDLSVLVSQMTSPKHAEDAQAAQKALRAACVRMADREACATELAAALPRAPVPSKPKMLEILSEVGSAKALSTIGAAVKGSDADLQDTGSRLLGEWMSVDAAPVLLDLAKSAPSEKYQVRALRGYIRLARQFVMPDQQRAEMAQSALDATNRPAEQQLALTILERYPCRETLDVAVKARKSPALKEDATRTALVIIQKLGDKAGDAKELLAKIGIDPVKVEIVKAEYGAGATQKDVTEALQKQVRDLPLIMLPSASYSKSFGGDPVPGTPKQLKVQYKINGKAGEAAFPENATVMLPMPK